MVAVRVLSTLLVSSGSSKRSRGEDEAGESTQALEIRHDGECDDYQTSCHAYSQSIVSMVTLERSIIRAYMHACVHDRCTQDAYKQD